MATNLAPAPAISSMAVCDSDRAALADEGRPWPWAEILAVIAASLDRPEPPGFPSLSTPVLLRAARELIGLGWSESNRAPLGTLDEAA